MPVQHINPDGLARPRGFTNVVVVSGPVRTIYIGGQDAVDATGAIVGKGDVAAQTEQVLHNLQVALEAAGARLEHVIKWNIYVVQGQSIGAGFAAFQRVWGARPNPPAITVAIVAGLANPDFRVTDRNVRTVAALGGYFYAVREDRVYVNLYGQGSADLDVKGNKIALTQTTEYPWKGGVRLRVRPEHRRVHRTRSDTVVGTRSARAATRS